MIELREEATGPSSTTVTDHPFTPKGEWWSLCEICGLSRASHTSTTPEGVPPYQRPPERPTAEGGDESEPVEDAPPFAGPEMDMLDVEAGELRKDA